MTERLLKTTWNSQILQQKRNQKGIDSQNLLPALVVSGDVMSRYCLKSNILFLRSQYRRSGAFCPLSVCMIIWKQQLLTFAIYLYLFLGYSVSQTYLSTDFLSEIMN